MGFSGFNQSVIAETLQHLEQEHSHILSALETRNDQVTLPMFSAHIAQGSEEEASKTLHLPALPSPPLDKEIEIAEFVETTIPVPEQPIPSRTEPVMADEIQPSSEAINELPPTLSSPAALGDSPPKIEADLTALNNLALDALLEKLMREHRFTWFQVPACEGCNLRRLMFGAYDHARRLVMFCNVRQEPSLSISVVNFDLGLKTGLTRPIYAEPVITHLLNDYLKSCAASA
jgi:hypothetical protein